MAIPTAVAIAGGDGRSAQGAPVVAALESEHKALAPAGVAHKLERVFDGLGTAHVKVHASLDPGHALHAPGKERRQFHLFAMQVLAGQLRQSVHGLVQYGVEPGIGIPEVDCGVPHLQIEIGPVSDIVQIASFTTSEKFRRIQIVDRIAKGAVFGFEREQSLFIHGGNILHTPNQMREVWRYSGFVAG